MGNSDNFTCGYGCKRKSNGYMECVCGYNICANCFDEHYSKNDTIAFDSQSYSYITDNLFSEKKIINFSSKADIESVKTDGFNRKNKRCNNGHNMFYMKNLENNICSYCKKGKKDNFLWTCYKCFEFSCESCSSQIKKKTVEENECFCCIIF
jgi:hypothetical protein